MVKLLLLLLLLLFIKKGSFSNFLDVQYWDFKTWCIYLFLVMLIFFISLFTFKIDEKKISFSKFTHLKITSVTDVQNAHAVTINTKCWLNLMAITLYSAEISYSSTFYYERKSHFFGWENTFEFWEGRGRERTLQSFLKDFYFQNLANILTFQSGEFWRLQKARMFTILPSLNLSLRTFI